MTTFKVGDTGKTRDGRDYRVIADDAGGNRSVVVLIANPATRIWNAIHVFRNGSIYSDGAETAGDLMPPAPPTRVIKRWLVAYMAATGGVANVVNSADEQFAAKMAAEPDSLMPDGMPQEVTMEILEKPRSA